MRKVEPRPRSDSPALLQQLQIRIPRDFPQRQHCAWLQNFQFAFQITTAIQNLTGQRLICGRCAAHCRRNVRTSQLQPIFSADRSRLVRESSLMQRLEQEITRAVAREYSSGAIPPMRRRRQPKNKQLRARIAETRNPTPPILPRAKCPPFFPRHFFAILHQPRTLAASGHLILYYPQSLTCAHRLPFNTPASTTA